MRSIVDGLEAEFKNEMAFRFVNALDGADGQKAFERLALPGHPSILIFKPGGEETYRGFGVIRADVLAAVIEKVLESR